MQSKRGATKDGRPVPGKGTVGAPKTTKAVSDYSVAEERVVRITLGDSVQDLGLRGAMVEIDLLGTGPEGFYRRLLAHPGGTDAEKVLTAADLLERIVAELQDARQIQRNQHDLTYWPRLLRLLQTAEELLRLSRVAGANPVATILEKAQRSLLLALKDRFGYDLPSWRGIEESITCALEWCTSLAGEVEMASHENQKAREEPTFGSLHDGPPNCRNLQDFAAGLSMASQAGLDLNNLEVGRGREGETACLIRGRLA